MNPRLNLWSAKSDASSSQVREDHNPNVGVVELRPYRQSAATRHRTYVVDTRFGDLDVRDRIEVTTDLASYRGWRQFSDT